MVFVKASWHPEQEQQLIDLWQRTDPPLTTRQIGAIMGMNKNKVIGKAHRLGMPSKKVAGNPGKKPYVRKPKSMKFPEVKRQPPKVPPKIEPVPGGVHITDLKDHHCRSIIGTGPDGLAVYCGANVAIREQRSRGVIVRNVKSEIVPRALAWCEGHAVVYLNEERRS